MAAENEGASAEVRLDTLPRYSLALVAGLHAIVLGTGALVLPFVVASWLSVSLGVLALLALSVSVLALLGRRRELATAWRVLSIGSLVFLAGLTWVVIAAGVYLSALYRSIGGAVTFGMLAFWAIAALFTVPIACWGLASTGGIPRRRRRAVVVGGGALLLLGLVFAFALGRIARLDRAPVIDGSAFARELARRATRESDADKERSEASLYHGHPVACSKPIVAGQTLLVTRLDAERRAVSKCLQSESAAGLLAALDREFGTGGSSGPALLDLVTASRVVPRVYSLLDALGIRPALDGVCSGKKCLLPHQLVALGVFTHFRPIPGLPTAALGSSLDELERALGASPGDGLLQIATQSYALRGGKVSSWVRLRREALRVDKRTVSKSVELAERHILAAQRESGAFRYTLDPFSGQADDAQVNIPRQAGTTYALCQLGRERRTGKAVQRALSQLAGYRRELSGDAVALSDLPEIARLGSTALPLAAYLTCRERVGQRYDALIGELSRFLLRMQRENGSFYPEFSLSNHAPRGEHESLYSAGQAVLALVLAEALAKREPELSLPPVAELTAAVDRAMDFYANRYWPAALRSLFYLEENWHCIAAEAALASHRNDAYERFCIDYTTFKSRLILTEADGADPEHVGGYSVTSMLPPHNATTAGFGEALAATLGVMKARGVDSTREQALLREVLSFLISQQWTEEACLLCAPDASVVGGFSENSASPMIRIDYVQHAMAAIGHGGRELGLL
jgi:hypothetical protein